MLALGDITSSNCRLVRDLESTQQSHLPPSTRSSFHYNTSAGSLFTTGSRHTASSPFTIGSCHTAGSLFTIGSRHCLSLPTLTTHCWLSLLNYNTRDPRYTPRRPLRLNWCQLTNGVTQERREHTRLAPTFVQHKLDCYRLAPTTLRQIRFIQKRSHLEMDANEPYW